MKYILFIFLLVSKEQKLWIGHAYAVERGKDWIHSDIVLTIQAEDYNEAKKIFLREQTRILKENNLEIPNWTGTKYNVWEITKEIIYDK